MNFVDARPSSMAPLPALKLEPPLPPLVSSTSSSHLTLGDQRASVVACVRRSISLAPARYLMLPSSPVSSCSGSATPPKDKAPLVPAGRQRWASSASWAVGASASSGDSLEAPPSYSSARAARLAPTTSAVAATPWGHDASESRQLSLRQGALAHSDSDGPQSMSRSTLPRCAVVNFRRDGDVVRWTPRARENTGGMAARVRNFDDAFQLEELSSRNFGFSNPRIHMRGGAEHMDISGVLAAAAEAGLGAPPPPQSRRQRLARALRMWRPAAAAPKGKQPAVSAVPTQSAPAAIQAKPALRRSVSATDLGCVPQHARRRAEGHVVTPKPRKQRWFARIASSRRGKRNDTALFDADALMIKHQAPQRATKPMRRVRSGWWQKADVRSTPTSKAVDNHRVRLSMRGAVDQYIEFMDDF